MPLKWVQREPLSAGVKLGGNAPPPFGFVSAIQETGEIFIFADIYRLVSHLSAIANL